MRNVVRLVALCGALVVPAIAGEDSAALFRAVRGGDIAFLQSHLTKASVDTRDGRGATLLMHAAAFGNLETLKMLVEAGADVNAANDFDATALLWCARDPEKAKLLIDHGAKVNVRSK